MNWSTGQRSRRDDGRLDHGPLLDRQPPGPEPHRETAKYPKTLSATSSRSGKSRAYVEMNSPSAVCAARQPGSSA